MLTDIFARRYESRKMFEAVGAREAALFVQTYRLINEQLLPYYGWDKKIDESSKQVWQSLHDRLSMEIGVKELANRYYSYQTEWMGKPLTQSGVFEYNLVMESWMSAPFQDNFDADVFVKRRLSFVELAFREREKQVAVTNSLLPQAIMQAKLTDSKSMGTGFRVPGSRVDGVKAANQALNEKFTANVFELNERFKQAGMPLHYHNGFIQMAIDQQVESQVEAPFWAVVADAKWANVDTDMKEAIDRRDTNGRDPALYAAKALESTIKIICADKGWTTGKERGAADFLNHLEAKANGPFIESWERQLIQRFFSDVRNDFGHGPGAAPMPTLSPQQTDFGIEFCMSWVKSLIGRL